MHQSTESWISNSRYLKKNCAFLRRIVKYNTVSEHTFPLEIHPHICRQPHSIAEHEPMDSAAVFKYDPLENVTKEIRLIHLLPGKAHDHLRIDIFSRELVAAKQDRTNRLSRDDIQQTLPAHWDASQTVEGRLLFIRGTDNVTITTWEHPIKDFDKSRFNTPVIGGLSPPSFSFEALSYVWGPQNNQVEIQVVPGVSAHGLVLNPGGSLCIGQALATALRHLRRENEERTLWIDARSIDQSNKVEKTGKDTSDG